MNLEKLSCLAKKYLENNSNFKSEELLKILKDEVFQDLITDILGSSKDLKTLAKSAYEHDNGFIKLILVDERPNYAIRLHIWPPKIMEDSAIHNHPWDLSGVVLLGQYTWVLYQEKEMGHRLKLYECQYLKDYSAHSFSYIKDVYMTDILKFDMRENCTYESKKYLYHKIVKNNEEWAVTLMICGNIENNIAHVITNTDKEAEVLIKNGSLRVDIIKYYLLKILEEIKNNDY